MQHYSIAGFVNRWRKVRRHGHAYRGNLANRETAIKACHLHVEGGAEIMTYMILTYMYACSLGACCFILCEDAALTGDQTLSPVDVANVLEEMLPAQNQSYLLGLKLKLPLHVVESIFATHSQPRDRLLQVLIAFMQQLEPRPTWSAIVDALRSPAINLLQLAKLIHSKHCPTLPAELVQGTVNVHVFNSR